MKIEPLDLFEVAAVAKGGLAGLAAVHASYPGSREVGGSPSGVKSGASTPPLPETEDAVMGFLRACDACNGKMRKSTYKVLAQMACSYGMVEPTERGVSAALEFCRSRLPEDKHARLYTHNIEKMLRRHRQGLPPALAWAGTDLGMWLANADRMDLAIIVLAHLMGGDVTSRRASPESNECLDVTIPISLA